MKKSLFWAGVIIIAVLAGYMAFQIGCRTAGKKYSGQIDPANPRKWVDNKWKFSIEFPAGWEPLNKVEPDKDSTGAEVSCGNKFGVTAKVFVHPVAIGETIDSIENVVFARYKSIYRNLAVIGKKAFIRGPAQYKVLVLKGTDTEHPDEVHFESFIFVNKVCLLVAFTCPTEKFQSFKKDFEGIIDSVVFS
jgi:hypothetical protein